MSATENSFSVIALGGLGEIGMNCLAVESAGRLLLIDCGAMFSSDDLGINLIHPGFEMLVERRNDIEGVVITHAHEDHIAGVPFLLREVDVPIYASPYTLGLLTEKMSEFDAAPRLMSHELTPERKTEIGPFAVTSFPMPHSISENTGLLIETPGGRILHTGDFKLNLLSPDRGEGVLSRLSQMAGDSIDLMLCDSTGSEEDEPAGQEATVAAALDRLVGAATGRIFAAIFSSNLQRLESIYQVAKRHGRKVALCGRSVQTHVRVASATGVLNIPPGITVTLDEAADLPRDRVLVVVSGTQGEPRSALGRLANDAHHALNVETDDLVILSSRFIPGNELAIGRVIDRLHRLGARVIHRGIQSDIHVSGHGSKNEITMAIEAVRPKGFMPLHGTYRHLIAGCKLAQTAGVKNTAIIADGQMARHTPSGLRVEENRFPARRVFIDGGRSLSENAIRDRRLLGSHGVLIVSFAMDGDGRLSGETNVIARGVTQDEALPWLSEQVNDKVKELLESMEVNDRLDSERCGSLIRSTLRRYLVKLLSREPYVLIAIIRI